jgi:hypothetical protein
MITPPENDTPLASENSRHQLVMILRILAAVSILYAIVAPFLGDDGEGIRGDWSRYDFEKLEIGVTYALIFAVVAQILTYLQDLVKYAERRDRQENNP